MKRQILKWSIHVNDGPQTVLMPQGAKVVAVQDQKGRLTFWADCDIDANTEPRMFTVAGTGHSIPASAIYCGTAQIGPFVWHLLELIR